MMAPERSVAVSILQGGQEGCPSSMGPAYESPYGKINLLFVENLILAPNTFFCKSSSLWWHHFYWWVPICWGLSRNFKVNLLPSWVRYWRNGYKFPNLFLIIIMDFKSVSRTSISSALPHIPNENQLHNTIVPTIYTLSCHTWAVSPLLDVLY